MLHKIVNALEEIIFPHYCLACHKKLLLPASEEALCPECSDALMPTTPPFCQKCGRTLSKITPERHICAECANIHFYFERAWASHPYKGVVKEMIHNFKYKHKLQLGKLLSTLLIDFVANYHIPIVHCDYVIPIPLTSLKLREREFNQAQILGCNFARHFGLPMLSNTLARLRTTASQAELDKNSRWKNIQGAFAVKNQEAIKGKSILVIDDVLTTGATASEAAHALTQKGARTVFVLTIAS